MQTGRRRCRILPAANCPNKVPCGSSLACCRRITVAATPYSPRAAASGRPLRITFCSTSGRRPSRAQASSGHSSRLGGNWVALICPATSNHRQAQADLEPVVSGYWAGGLQARVSLVYPFLAPPLGTRLAHPFSGSASLGAGSRVRTSRVQKLKAGTPPGELLLLLMVGSSPAGKTLRAFLCCARCQSGQCRLITCCPDPARHSPQLCTDSGGCRADSCCPKVTWVQAKVWHSVPGPLSETVVSWATGVLFCWGKRGF